MKIKSFLFILLLSFIVKSTYSQNSGTIFIGGDFDKFYPVVFNDAWPHTGELELSRFSVHQDADWCGSLAAKFRFHTTNWGNGSQFIDADIKQFSPINNTKFIAGWKDATTGNGLFCIIIWLRGAVHYNYNTNAGAAPMVYDGVQNPLPYNEMNGPAHTFKTAIEPYVNSAGISNEGTANFNGNGINTFMGSLSVGGYDDHGYKLSVNGSIRAKEIKVEPTNWPDYVFETDFKPVPIAQLKEYVIKNKHLPEIPSTQDVEHKGINLAEMNAMLLKKIEELTLYIIELNDKVQDIERKVKN